MREQMEQAKTFEPQDQRAQVSWRFEEQKLEESENDYDCDLSDVNYQSAQIDIPKPHENQVTAKKYLGESPDAGTRMPTNGPEDSPDVLIKKKNREQAEERKAIKPPALDFDDWDEQRKG